MNEEWGYNCRPKSQINWTWPKNLSTVYRNFPLHLSVDLRYNIGKQLTEETDTLAMKLTFSSHKEEKWEKVYYLFEVDVCIDIKIKKVCSLKSKTWKLVIRKETFTSQMINFVFVFYTYIEKGKYVILFEVDLNSCLL